MATDPSTFTPAPAPPAAVPPTAVPPATMPATAATMPATAATMPATAATGIPIAPTKAATPIIEIKGLTKRYRDLVAVRDLNLTIESGEVFGFIGPNGAGKTTTIKSLATLLEFTSGSVKVDGIDVLKHPLEVRRIIGYMPDFFGVYDDVKVWEYLDFFAAAYKIPANKRKAIIDDVLELTDLTEKRESYVEGLSRGMKQRLCLAKTLVHDPKLLLLDEPASGLDPRARIEFRALLKELRQMGKTIFVSSHILPELADFCTSVGIMERGQLVVAGRVHDIVQKLEGSILLDIRLTGNNENGVRALEVVRAHPLVKEAKAEGNHLTVSFVGTNDELPQLLAALIQAQLPVAAFGQREADLEDVFMRVTKGMVQ